MMEISSLGKFYSLANAPSLIANLTSTRLLGQ